MTEPMSDGDRLAYMGTDASSWTAEFLKQFAGTDTLLDEGMLIGWFANAIGAGQMSVEHLRINQLGFWVHETALKNGWWNDGREFGTVVALIHSEASEALEEWRNGRDTDETYYVLKVNSSDKITNGVYDAIQAFREDDIELTDEQFKLLFEKGYLKPEGIPAELADVVIRVMDAAVHYGIDLEASIIEKMNYNKTRDFRHGGKKA